MKRFEIICDASIETTLLEKLDDMKGITGYTYLAPVDGTGNHGPRRGNHVWPEENAMAIIYLEDQYTEELTNIIFDLRKRFPNNGVACFYMETAHSI